MTYTVSSGALNSTPSIHPVCLQHHSIFSARQTCSHRQQTLQAPVSINPWFTATLRAFRSTLRHAENIWKRTHSAADWSSFKSLRNQYHKLILSSKKEYYSSLVSSASNNPKRLWQTVNKLLHCKSSSPLPTTSGTSLADSGVLLKMEVSIRKEPWRRA